MKKSYSNLLAKLSSVCFSNFFISVCSTSSYSSVRWLFICLPTKHAGLGVFLDCPSKEEERTILYTSDNLICLAGLASMLPPFFPSRVSIRPIWRRLLISLRTNAGLALMLPAIYSDDNRSSVLASKVRICIHMGKRPLLIL